MKNNILSCVFKNSPQLTVGEVKKLECKGDIPLNISPKLKIQFEDIAQKYSLFVLETEKIEDKKINLKVTSYKTGLFENTSFILTDGHQNLIVDNLSWETISVLKNDQVKPYPPYGPWFFSFPSWYVLSWVGLILIAFVLGYFQFRKIQFGKKIKQKISHRLKNQSSVQYFIYQLSRFFTQDIKEEELFLDHLKKSLREFLENKFYIPEEYSVEKALKILKKEKINEIQYKKISQIFLEIDKMEKDLEKNKRKGLKKNQPKRALNENNQQLLSMIRNWVFECERSKK